MATGVARNQITHCKKKKIKGKDTEKRSVAVVTKYFGRKNDDPNINNGLNNRKRYAEVGRIAQPSVVPRSTQRVAGNMYIDSASFFCNCASRRGVLNTESEPASDPRITFDRICRHPP